MNRRSFLKLLTGLGSVATTIGVPATLVCFAQKTEEVLYPVVEFECLQNGVWTPMKTTYVFAKTDGRIYSRTQETFKGSHVRCRIILPSSVDTIETENVVG